MKVYSLYQAGRPIADRAVVADDFFTRFKGLMLRKSLSHGEGLLLKNCSAIHCCFMRFTIDAVYLDNSMQVIAIETIKPWRLGGIFHGAKHVLELEAGSARNLTPGMQIEWKECTMT